MFGWVIMSHLNLLKEVCHTNCINMYKYVCFVACLCFLSASELSVNTPFCFFTIKGSLFGCTADGSSFQFHCVILTQLMPLVLITCVARRGATEYTENMQCCLYLMSSWARVLTSAHTEMYTCTPTCVNTHKPRAFTKSIYCNSFIYRGSVYLAYVMGRLIGGFSNYELGKAAGWRRQSDPSLLL